MNASRFAAAGAVAAWAFAAVTAVHLGALVTGWATGAQVTMALLVPPLWVYLASVLGDPLPRAGRRTVIFGLVALFFGWLGDLNGDILAKLAMFGVGHLAYCRALWPWRQDSWFADPRTRRRALVLGGLAVVGLLAILLPHAGWMTAAVGVYALTLGAMAVLAPGAGRRAAVGGVLFGVSDAALAWHVFVAPLPLGDVMVMATYLAAQWLLVSGTRRRLLR